MKTHIACFLMGILMLTLQTVGWKVIVLQKGSTYKVFFGSLSNSSDR